MIADEKNPEFIRCPHCQMEFRLMDLEPTLDKGNFKCHVCSKKFPSPLPEHKYIAPPSRTGGFRAPVYIVLAVVIALVSVYYFKSASKITPVAVPSSSPAPVPGSLTGKTASAQDQSSSEKLQIIERIAADFHKNHTYTKEGDFVCVDMAVAIWNQLTTCGIEAKIMGGTIHEDISGWDYRQLVERGDHAWVVAHVSPSEKVAIETTAGVVLRADSPNAAPYFRGIVFDNPAQIKKFEFIKRQAKEVCQEANQLINEWNNNIAGRVHRSDATHIKQSKIEQRKQDCNNTIIKLEEFRSRAVFR